ncbi:MAG: hypothetical protein P8J59_01120 [Phycisphaerales bacterium]|jgi:hypothetical protein|nr:hypothetical protein [Phycisphaerales bacterium]
MPILPSGARIWLSMAAILEPQTRFLPCRSGQFWYRDLDPATGWLPGDPGRPPKCLRTATVPTSRIEVASHVQVIIAAADEEESRWRGDWLLTFDRPDDFSVADWEASLEFFGSERTKEFLDHAIKRCKRQADANETLDLVGFEPTFDPHPQTASRLARASGAMSELSRRRAESEVGHDEKDVHLVEERFEAMYEFADRTLDLYGPHRALAHHLLAATATELGDVDDAIHHVRACSTLLPQDQAFTADLIARLQRTKRDGAIRLGPRLRSSCERAGEV